MALQKTVTDDRGNAGNYWVIRELSLDPRAKMAEAHVVMFKDKATADANKNGDANTAMMADHRTMISGDDFNDLAVAALNADGQNPYAAAYEKIKLLTTPVDFTTRTTDA